MTESRNYGDETLMLRNADATKIYGNMRYFYLYLMVLPLLLCACMHDDDMESAGSNLSVGDSMPLFQIRLNIPDSLDWRVASAQYDASTSSVVVRSDELKGKQVYLMFFNTTCKDCQRELPNVQKMYEENRGDSTVVFMAVAREQGREDIEEYWQREGLTLPYSEQNDRKVFNLFATQTIPQLFVINEQGVIVKHVK